MPQVYQSPVKETTHKTLLESPHPHRPYQAHAVAEEEVAHIVAAKEADHSTAVEEAAHSAAEEAAQAHTPVQTEPDTPGDTHIPPDTDSPAEIQADTPAPDNAAHAGTVLGPPSVTSIPPQHQP